MENPKKYKGIEYVQLNELPAEQQDILKTSLNQDLFIKILVNGNLFQDCILYKDYQNWFEEIYKKNRSKEQEKTVSASLPSLEPIPVSKFHSGKD